MEVIRHEPRGRKDLCHFSVGDCVTFQEEPSPTTGGGQPKVYMLVEDQTLPKPRGAPHKGMGLYKHPYVIRLLDVDTGVLTSPSSLSMRATKVHAVLHINPPAPCAEAPKEDAP